MCGEVAHGVALARTRHADVELAQKRHVGARPIDERGGGFDELAPLNIPERDALGALVGGARFQTFRADVADAGAVAGAFTGIDRFFEGAAPDVFVSCAAVSRGADFFSIALEDFDRAVAVNLRGLFLTAREAGIRMRSAGTGHMVMVTSVVAECAWAYEVAHSATKAAQLGLVRSLAVELAPWGIAVNAVGPGIVEVESRTLEQTRDRGDGRARALSRTPLARFADAAEVAETVRFLATVTGMTGQTVYVDGGFLATGLGYSEADKARLASASG
jgi:NAD(P)-dependent dehydrogenase (short-subunit alcohol dehydrogenase family)